MARAAFDSKVMPWALAAPQLLLVAVVFYWPAAQALLWSLHLERPFGGPSPFVGLDNFTALFEDDVFLRSLATSAVFTGATTLASLFGALALAVAVDRRLPGSRPAGALLVWPYAVAAPAAGLVMALVLDPRLGLAAGLNDWYPGLWSPASNGTEALVMVVLAFVWLHVPFNFVFLLAALRALPCGCLEAAAIDGAGPWLQLVTIRLPLLIPYLFFVLVLDMTESFTQSFGLINVTTHGGPGGATNILVYNIYADGFVGLDFSRASAESVVLMLTMAVLAAAQFRWFSPPGRKV
jgi:sn-glycerol 3-phosphate transport system permease protein